MVNSSESELLTANFEKRELKTQERTSGQGLQEKTKKSRALSHKRMECVFHKNLRRFLREEGGCSSSSLQ